MVKARTGRSDNRAIAAATADESTPPDRKTPSGTSASRCRRTVSSHSARNSSTHSASLRCAAGPWRCVQ
jgi:hypothetical protein